MKAKSPKLPEIAQAVPVPQLDSPELIDVRRRVRTDAMARQGARASLLTPGGAQGISGGGGTTRRTLGYGAV